MAKRNVSLPAAVARGAAASRVLPPLPNACQILNLRLGPINLDLLGLVVQDQPDQRADRRQRGPGNLLGNLLCAITGISIPRGSQPARTPRC